MASDNQIDPLAYARYVRGLGPMWIWWNSPKHFPRNRRGDETEPRLDPGKRRKGTA